MGFRAPRKLYRHPRAKRKGVYRFTKGSKSRRPRGFQVFILYSWQPIKSLSVLATETVSNHSVRKTSHRDGDFYSSCSRLTDNSVYSCLVFGTVTPKRNQTLGSHQIRPAPPHDTYGGVFL